MTEPATGDGEPAADVAGGPRKMPLFFFFTCKTTGHNFLSHAVLDIAVHCWPYDDGAPVFYSRVNHAAGGAKSKSRNRSKGPRLRRGQNGEDDTSTSSSRNCAAARVLERLLQWIDNAVDKAGSALGLSLYPVLIAHWGETFQFLFLFRMLEKFGISAMETLGAHGVHFADPVPVLKQYKEVKHPWLVESRSLGLGSLLNDWFPAQFDEAGLMCSRSCGALVLQLYTQSPLYWLLYHVPIYSTREWTDFYEGEKVHRKDKRELQGNLPSGVVGMQRKLTIRQLLRYGYNWSCLTDLYKSCGSPRHFRQELRDMDIRTGPAGRITATMGAMHIEQEGSREYKVRIKSNMQYVKYYHETDARGRHFILRVANVLPPCFFSLDDLLDDRWRVPDSLLRIGPPETWDAMLPRCAGNAGKNPGDEKGVEGHGSPGADVPGRRSHESERSDVGWVLNDVSESSSETEWDRTVDDDSPLCENGELPDCYFMEPAPTHIPTTLVKGTGGVNPFVVPEQEWLAVESGDHRSGFPEPDLLTDEKCSENSSGSSNQSKAICHSAPANLTTLADLNSFTADNRETSENLRSLRKGAISRHSTAANPNRSNPARSNQEKPPVLCHSASANQSSPSRRKPAKLFSSNRSSCTSRQNNASTSTESTSASDSWSIGSHDSVLSNQRGSMESRACPATNHSSQDGSLDLSSTSPSKLCSDELDGYRSQGAIPKEQRQLQLSDRSKKKHSQSAPANHMTAKQVQQSSAANRSSPDKCRGPSPKPLSSDKFHVPSRYHSKEKKGGKKSRHES